tara:strand:+ start:479 stop:679 length:201 start_codon:yes stop_codon:yes gene_type:complete
MANDIDNPFTESDLSNMEEGLKVIATTRAGLKKAQLAGFSQTENLAKLDEQEKQLKQIKRVYFPNV